MNFRRPAHGLLQAEPVPPPQIEPLEALNRARIPAHLVAGDAQATFDDFKVQMAGMERRLSELLPPVDVGAMEDPAKARSAHEKRRDAMTVWFQDLIHCLDIGRNVLSDSRQPLENQLRESEKAVTAALATSERHLRAVGLNELRGGLLGRDQSANKDAARNSFAFAVSRTPLVLDAQQEVQAIEARIADLANVDAQMNTLEDAILLRLQHELETP